jgi:hypothetical protein
VAPLVLSAGSEEYIWLFMSQSSVGRGRGAVCQRTSISSIPLCRLGDIGIMGKLAAWAEAGTDDAMLARREKAIFCFGGLHGKPSPPSICLRSFRGA